MCFEDDEKMGWWIFYRMLVCVIYIEREHLLAAVAVVLRKRDCSWPHPP